MNDLHNSRTLPAFDSAEERSAKVYLAAQVASMMGRKMEEGDWTGVYRRAKGIPDAPWSNLGIDINHQGLGVEHKLLRCSNLRRRPIKVVCGTTRMHPAATRSIRIQDVNAPAKTVMREVLEQYNSLIDGHSAVVREGAATGISDLRIGWLLWETSLTEFLYFEERFRKVDPNRYYAEWNETPARGARKGSRSLWIFDRETNQKRYSVTTSAGIKIQPYFDVPAPGDPNLYYFRVQSEPLDSDTVQIWVTSRTAESLARSLGKLTKFRVSDAILRTAGSEAAAVGIRTDDQEIAVPIPVSRKAFEVFCETWDGVSDEHRAQLFLRTWRRARR